MNGGSISTVAAELRDRRVRTRRVVQILLVSIVGVDMIGSSERDGDYNTALALFGIVGVSLNHSDLVRSVLAFDCLAIIPDMLWLSSRGTQIHGLHGESASVGSQKFSLICAIIVLILKSFSMYFLYDLDMILRDEAFEGQDEADEDPEGEGVIRKNGLLAQSDTTELRGIAAEPNSAVF